MNEVSIEQHDNGWRVYSTRMGHRFSEVFTSLADALNRVALGVTDWEQYRIGSQVEITNVRDERAKVEHSEGSGIGSEQVEP